MLKSKGRPVQGQISSKYCKIHLIGVVKVSVFTKATLFGRTYRYPRAMFCSQWLFVRHPCGDLYLLFVRESVHFIGFFCDCWFLLIQIIVFTFRRSAVFLSQINFLCLRFAHVTRLERTVQRLVYLFAKFIRDPLSINKSYH